LPPAKAGINRTGFFVLLSAVQVSSGSQTKQSEEPLVIYPQKGRQPDQNPGFYTTGLVLANQHRNLDALNLKIALDHAAAGIRVFPVSVIQGPDGRWKKRPAIKGWKDVATTDPDQIRRWWQEFPEAVPGTELGRAGLVVIDADRHDPNQDGVQAFAGLRAGAARLIVRRRRTCILQAWYSETYRSVTPQPWQCSPRRFSSVRFFAIIICQTKHLNVSFCIKYDFTKNREQRTKR
jgi:hypothetical protein